MTRYTNYALESDDPYAMLECDYNMLMHGTPEGDPREHWIPLAKNPEYQVSTQGHVRRFLCIELCVQQWEEKYPLVSVRIPGSTNKTLREAHRLVATTFFGLLPKGMHTRHLEGDVSVYHVNALEYGSPKQNAADKLSPKKTKPPKKETWRNALGYIGLWVSSHGRFRQYCAKAISTPAITYHSGKRKGQRKHVCFGMYKNGLRIDCSLHREMWIAFNGVIPKGKVVAHIDGNPHNNNLDNLTLKSYRDNTLDRLDHGTMNIGTTHPNSKLTAAGVLKISELLASWPVRKIAAKFKVSTHAIYKIKSGENWSHVTGITWKAGVLKEPWWIAFRTAVIDGTSMKELMRNFKLTKSRATLYSRMVLNNS